MQFPETSHTHEGHDLQPQVPLHFEAVSDILPHLLNICQKYLKMAMTILENSINQPKGGRGSVESEKEKKEGRMRRERCEREGWRCK